MTVTVTVTMGLATVPTRWDGALRAGGDDLL
jgi:hypothetical protein